jgi:non-specific serine/threonine protein kinase
LTADVSLSIAGTIMPSAPTRDHDDREGSPHASTWDIASGPAGRLPEPLTSFVGRRPETERLLAMARRSELRLITLTGPGGAGKTRLALRVASEIERSRDCPVTFVSLAPASDRNLVLSTIGRGFGVTEAAGVTPLDRLAETIGDARRLLVLDNFEHVVDAASLLTTILSRCRGLTILVTSRILLRLSGEHEVAVGPLAVPPESATPGQIAVSDAVRLLLDRVSASASTEELWSDDAELPAIAAICRRLEGLPLAIELAAARARVLSPRERLAGLEGGRVPLDRGPRDAPARHRSLHDAVAWSYDLLTPEQQQIFRLLSVFSGGFTLAAAEELYTTMNPQLSAEPRPPEPPADGSRGRSHAFDLLSSLVEQSLVGRYAVAGGQPRFTMLETIREFGQEMLVAEGEERAVRDTHASWFASLANDPTPSRASLPSVTGADPLQNEHDNLRAAIVWSLAHDDAETAGRLASRLWRFWAQHGLDSEARATIGNILRSAISPELRASLLLDAARSAWCQSDFATGGELAAEARAIYARIGHQAGIAASLVQLGDAALADAPDIAVSYFQEAIALQRTHGDAQALENALQSLGDALMYTGDLAAAKAAYSECLTLMAAHPEARWLLNPLGWVALVEGDLDLAERVTEESLAYTRELGFPYPQAVALRLLGRVALGRNQLSLAAERYHEALSIMSDRGAQHEAGYCIAELAAVAAASGEAALAARWLAFEEAQRKRQRLGLSPDEASVRDEARQQARALLGDDAFAAAWDEGSGLTAGAAIAEAQAWRPPAPARRDTPLTRRELEVLQRLAEGRTNHEIADSLFLGQRTVESHVAGILAKLDVSSRHAAVGEARRRGLIDT